MDETFGETWWNILVTRETSKSCLLPSNSVLMLEILQPWKPCFSCSVGRTVGLTVGRLTGLGLTSWCSDFSFFWLWPWETQKWIRMYENVVHISVPDDIASRQYLSVWHIFSRYWLFWIVLTVFEHLPSWIQSAEMSLNGRPFVNFNAFFCPKNLIQFWNLRLGGGRLGDEHFVEGQDLPWCGDGALRWPGHGAPEQWQGRRYMEKIP